MGSWIRKMVMFDRRFILMAGCEPLYEWWPENKTAKLLCRLAGKDKLNKEHIEVLEQIGFDIYLVQHVRDEHK